MLFHVEAAVRMGGTAMPSRSVLCSWSATSSSGKVQASKIADINFSKPRKDHPGKVPELSDRQNTPSSSAPQAKGNFSQFLQSVKESYPDAKLFKMLPSMFLRPRRH
ncbi:uncharacterized protein LOC115320085 [Ixodes scapularis]|uniref:uncharacterized protein LOC115320085 n=1 Tax=Ixodes scapularis TaxID=6945 RepID=UPI001A9FD600|nr:uncharacterized protein LOC115320085 [Ixodes scapularis]